jgi:hypothetical protein
MSNEIFDNPVFASNIIPKFTQNEEIDSALLDNLEMETYENLSYTMFPIVEQVPENKRGIVRLFIANTGDLSRTIHVYYSLVGWFSDLHKDIKKTLIEKITINPKEVWYRDIVFKSNIKQGKNYFKISFYENKKLLKSSHIEYLQIRDIQDIKQIERSNFLGMTSKPYINPRAANYWVFYSLFGKKKYVKESPVLIVFKLVGFLGGATFVTLALLMQNLFPEVILPVSAIIAILSFLSFFSNLDDKYVKQIYNFKLTKNTRRGTLFLAKQMPNETLQKYCFSGLNYGYETESDTLYWKEGAIKLYEKLIPLVGRLLHLSTDIKPTSVVLVSKVEEIKDKDELKKKIEEGIQLHYEEGIRFDEGVDPLGEDAEAVKTDVQVFDSDTSMQPEVTVIKTETTMEPEVEIIETKTKMEPEIDPIETDSSMDIEIDPIETDSSMDIEIDPIKIEPKKLVSKVRGVVIGKHTDVATIPEPKKLPFTKKDDTKKSAKNIDDTEK